MKRIKYRLLTEQNAETEEQAFLEKTMNWNEINEETAKEEAYNGEYEIYDDGEPAPVVEPTTDDVLNALLGVTE